LQIARESLILLENKNRTLPLDKVRKIAVIGPNSDNAGNQLGDYTSPQRDGDVVTVRGGFEQLAGKRGLEISWAPGCKIRSQDRSGFAEAERLAADADAVVVVLGGSSSPDTKTEFRETGAALAQKCLEDNEQDKDSGEGYDRARLALGGVQLELLRRLKECANR
jgi:beta-glucosidase